jgi:hypothetical protein
MFCYYLTGRIIPRPQSGRGTPHRCNFHRTIIIPVALYRTWLPKTLSRSNGQSPRNTYADDIVLHLKKTIGPNTTSR